MKSQDIKSMDRISVIERRFEIMTVAKLRDKTGMKNAMKIQDWIRKRTKGGISLTREIRKWRDLRYASSS
jgi:hypothetical protein